MTVRFPGRPLFCYRKPARPIRSLFVPSVSIVPQSRRALLGGPRLGYRLFKDRGLDHIVERARGQRVPVLLISTKEGADTFVRETVRDRNAVYRVIGMLSDTPSRVGRQIYGVPILGTIDALETVVADLDRRGRRPQ